MSSNASADLRDRRQAATRAEIFRAAIELFIEHGFDATSMVDVADASGVSRRTVYRHFASKDDIVFEPPRQWFEVLNAVLEARAHDEPTREVCRRAATAVAEEIAATREMVLKAFSVLLSTPSLASRHGASDREWQTRIAGVVLDDLGDDLDDVLRAHTVGGALIGALNALIAVWAMAADEDLVAMMDAVLDQLDSFWPPECRLPPA